MGIFSLIMLVVWANLSQSAVPPIFYGKLHCSEISAAVVSRSRPGGFGFTPSYHDSKKKTYSIATVEGGQHSEVNLLSDSKVVSALN
jgi:hypothetical protein